MRFSVCHETNYRYSAPLVLAAHFLRLRPRSNKAVLLMHRLSIDPAASVWQDRYGNLITRLEFDGSTHHLRIERQFDLEVRVPLAPGTKNARRIFAPWPVQVMRRSAGVAARRMQLAENAIDEADSGSCRIRCCIQD